jgi:hypothetical protein
MTGTGEGGMFDIEDTPLSIEIMPGGDGKVKLTAYCTNQPVTSSKHTWAVFSEPGERNKFLSSVEESLKDRAEIDAAGARTKIKDCLAGIAEMKEEAKEEYRETVLSKEANDILAGTRPPVEVYRGEPTTWIVTLTFRGETRELEFTTGEMLSDSADPLEEKIANHFLEFHEIGSEEWEEIKEYWAGNKRVIETGEETAADVVADRVLEYLRDGCLPLTDREKLANDPGNVWFDETNGTAYENAGPDAAIAWVQSRYLLDKIESAGKSLEYKGQLTKDLINRGDLYGKSVRRRWSDGQRERYYPFDPDALGIDPEQIGEATDSAESEVDV